MANDELKRQQLAVNLEKFAPGEAEPEFEEDEGCTARERLFARYYVENSNGAAAAKAAGYGTENTTAVGFAVEARRLLRRQRVQALVIALSRAALRSLAPRAVQALGEMLNERHGRERLGAAKEILARTDAAVSKLDVSHTIKFDPVRAVLDLIAQRQKQGLSRAEIMRLEGFSDFELQHYEKMLAAKDAPIDAEFTELPAPGDDDPDFSSSGELKE